MKKNKLIIDIIWKAALIISVSLTIICALNYGMSAFLRAETDANVAAAKKAASLDTELEEKLLSSTDIKEQNELILQRRALALSQQEQFYQTYAYANDRSYYYHYYGKFYELYKQVESANVLILGSSHAVYGLNPKYLEQADTGDNRYYNFALNGATPSYYLDWYNGPFTEAGYQTPDTVIFCVDWFMFDSEWMWRTIGYDTPNGKGIDVMRKIIAADKDGEESKEDEEPTGESSEKPAWYDIDAWETYIFGKIPLISERDRIPEMISWVCGGAEPMTVELADMYGYDKEYEHDYFRDSWGDVVSEYYKGFVPWEANSLWGVSSRDAVRKGYEENYADLQTLLDIFEAQGTKVIFVMLPEYIPGRTAASFDKYNDIITDIAAERDIPYLNYNTELKSDINYNSDFYSDWGHMNTAGSDAFSGIFARDIQKYLS